MLNSFTSSFQFGRRNIIGFTKSGLILYYDPSNADSYPGSGTTINSLVSPNLSGTLSNITYTSPAFNYGGNSYVSIADNSSLEPGSGSWTMEAWFNVSSASTSGVILGKFDNGGLAQNVSYSIRYNTSRSLVAQFSNGSPSTFVESSSYTFSLNTWYQVVYVWTNSGLTKTIDTYINGSLIGTVNHTFASILNSTNPLYLGSYNGGEYSQYVTGKIGVTRLYNRSLNSAEVAQNYNNDKSRFGL
jgi:hypothetical protein